MNWIFITSSIDRGNMNPCQKGKMEQKEGSLHDEHDCGNEKGFVRGYKDSTVWPGQHSQLIPCLIGREMKMLMKRIINNKINT